MPLDARHLIANWSPYARPTDSRRVFSSPGHAAALRQIRAGDAWLVLGRKGAGKSALIYKFRDDYASDIAFRKQEFDPNLLHSRLTFFGGRFDRTIAEKVFKLDILQFAAQELQFQAGLQSHKLALAEIGRYYEKKLDVRARGIISALISPVAKLITGRKDVEDIVRSSPLFSNIALVDQELTKITNSFRQLYADNEALPPIYIVFDEIDVKLGDKRNTPHYDDYTDVLKSLLAACATFTDLRDLGIKIYPIVVLRNDVFETVHHGDQNKWARSAINIRFDKNTILDVLRFRLCAELKEAGNEDNVFDLTFNDVWRQVVDSNATAWSWSKKRLLPAMLERTLYRPRDVVLFMREMAAKSVARTGSKQITASDFKNAQQPYSSYFWNEFLDEMGYKYPFAGEFERLLDGIFFPANRTGTFMNLVRGEDVKEHARRFMLDLAQRGFQLDHEALISDFVSRSVLGIQVTRHGGISEEMFAHEKEVPSSPGFNVQYTLHNGVADYFRSRHRVLGIAPTS